MRKFILILFIAVCSVYSQGADTLVGVWQDNEVVASGWSNTFLFFADGTFKFFYNQMDLRKNQISFSGSWNVDGDGLYFDVKQRSYLEGGRLVENPNGAKGDSMLVDAAQKTKLFNPPEKVEMSISKIYTDTEFAMGKYIYIDAMKFYLMSTKPVELIKQFEDK